MVAFQWLNPYVTSKVAGWFDIDVDRPFVVAYDDDDFSEPGLGTSICSVPDVVVRDALAVGVVDDDEVWRRLMAEVSAWTCAVGSAFVVAGPDLVTIRSTIPNQFAPGDEFDPDDHMEAFVIYHPIRSESGDVRWLCLVPPGGPFGPNGPHGASEAAAWPDLSEMDLSMLGSDSDGAPIRFPENAIVATEEEIERRFSRFHELAVVVSWALPFAGALLLGVVISWLVTRRIVRLSQAAADPAIDSFERFEARGGDEIAGLGAALAEARRSVAGLVREVGDKDAQRREWFAQVSHDIRTPLTALSACLERAAPIAAEVESKDTRERLESTLDVAREDTERVHALASDLLEVARLELPDALDVEALLPNEVVERAVTMLRPLAEREGKSLNFQASSSHSLIHGDGNRLMRAMENLIRNAIEHGRSSIDVTVTDTEDGVTVEVEDDGPGFNRTADGGVDTDRLGRARADSAGLGLVVVKRVLEAHGSMLELGTSRKGGAAARFRLASMDDFVEAD